jgi:hypothetical protein
MLATLGVPTGPVAAILHVIRFLAIVPVPGRVL